MTSIATQFPGGIKAPNVTIVDPTEGQSIESIGGVLTPVDVPTKIKQYVDLSSASFHLTEYFSATASDIGGIYKLMDRAVASPATVVSAEIATNTTTNVYNFATAAGQPHLVRLLPGPYKLHAHLLKTGNRTVNVYYELYKRVLAGAETLLATSNTTVALTASDAFYDVIFNLDAEVTLLETDRIVLKVYAITTGSAGNTTVTTTVGGIQDSHFSIDIEGSELPSIFVPYTGAEAAVNLGVYGLTAATLTAAVGSAAAPSIYFGTDIDTGFYSVGANAVGFAAGGSHVFTAQAGGLQFTVTSGVTEHLRFNHGVAPLNAVDNPYFELGYNWVNGARVDITKPAAALVLESNYYPGSGANRTEFYFAGTHPINKRPMMLAWDNDGTTGHCEGHIFVGDTNTFNFVRVSDDASIFKAEGVGPNLLVGKYLTVPSTGKACFGQDGVTSNGATVQIQAASTTLGLFVSAATGGGAQISATGGIVSQCVGYGAAVGTQIQVASGAAMNIYKQYAQTGHDYASVVQIHRLTSGTYTVQGDILYINDSPTNSGAVSGKILKTMVDGVERIGFNPRVADGATAVAHFFDTKGALANAASRVFSWRNSGTESMGLTGKGNLLLNATATDGAASGVLVLGNGTAPSAITANQISIYASDTAASLSTLSLFLEEEVVNEVKTCTGTLRININGTTYRVLLASGFDA